MPRLDPFAGPGFARLSALSSAVDDDCGLPDGLVELVKLRCSQLNGCAYCVRMHAEKALAAGEPQERVDRLDSWRTDVLFGDTERAVLALAEAVTLVADEQVPDKVLDEAIASLGEKSTQQVVWVVAVINAFNRLAITARIE